MKTMLLPVLGFLAAFQLHAGEIENPAISYVEFRKLVLDLDSVRAARRVSEEDFIKMAAEPGTVVFDARSTDKFDRIHVKGALHLPFTDFTDVELRKVIPDKKTRILIYCNNNFDKEPVGFASKTPAVALNIQTFVNLHAYGYTNVYELGPLLDVRTTKIPFEGNGVLKIVPKTK
jgi:phage shock protein E